jgi:WD40 repeat protein
MQDDDFMKSLREDVPDDFARDLYAQLMREEQVMNTGVRQNGTLHEPILKPTSRRQPSRYVAMVATFTALLMCSLIFALSPNNPTLQKPPLTINTATTITAQNADSLQLIETLGRGTAESVAWSPDGNTIAVAGSQGIHLHDANDLEAPTTLFGDQPISTRDIAYGPDWSTLAGIRDNTLYLWDVETAEALLQIEGVSRFIRFKTDASQMAGIVKDEEQIEVHVWDTETGEVLDTIEIESDYDVKMSGNFQWLGYVGNYNWGLNLIDVEAETVFEISKTSPTSFDLSDDGRWMVTSNWISRNGISLYDLEEPSPTSVFRRTNHFVTNEIFGETLSVGFFPESLDALIVTERDAFIISIEEDGVPELKRTFNLIPNLTVWSFTEFAFKAGESEFALLDYTGVLQMWDTQGESSIVEAPGQQYLGYSTYMRHILFSPDDEQVIGMGYAGLAKQWDLQTSSESVLLAEKVLGDLNSITEVVYTPDNNLLYAYSDQLMNRNIFGVVNLETGEDLYEAQSVPRNFVFGVGEDGELLSIAYDRTIYNWSAETPPDFTSVEGNPDFNYFDKVQAAFSPDGRLLVGSVCVERSADTPGNLCNMSEIRVWSVKTGALMEVLEGGIYPITEIVFSRDSRYAAATQCESIEILMGYLPECVNPVVLVWDLEGVEDAEDVPLAPMATLPGETYVMSSIAFHPKDNSLITAADGRMIRLWGIGEGEAELLHTVSSYARSVTFNNAGTLLAAGGEGIVELWGTKE